MSHSGLGLFLIKGAPPLARGRRSNMVRSSPFALSAKCFAMGLLCLYTHMKGGELGLSYHTHMKEGELGFLLPGNLVRYGLGFYLIGAKHLLANRNGSTNQIKAAHYWRRRHQSKRAPRF